MFPVISQAANAISSYGKSFAENARKASSIEETSGVGASGPGWDGALQSRQASVQASPQEAAQAVAAMQADQRGIESNVKMIRTANEMIGTLLDIVV